MRRPLPLLLLLIGCDEGATKTPAEKPVAATNARVAGVWPDKFDCNTIATADQLATVLGAPAKPLDVAMSTPRGVPKPCTYEIAAATPESWTIDFDCRDNYKKTADALFAQYKQINADRIDSYNAITDAGVTDTPPKGAKDAGVVYVQPGVASDVQVGAKGLDHNDQGILFIDDDAPCYVRVMGPDATRRLELARHVAKALTYENAPMTPRALPSR